MIRLPRYETTPLRMLAVALALARIAIAQPASLDGRVTDSGGDPLPKVTVTLQGLPTATVSLQPSYRATSDAEGKFTFESIAPGDYALSAERAGYLPTQYRATPRETSARITVTSGQHLAGMSMAMTRTATISGRVLDAGGDPVAGVSVSLLQQRYGQPGLESRRSAITDDSGAYQIIDDRAQGEYYLTAGAEGEAAMVLLGLRAVTNTGGYHEAKPGQAPEYYAGTFYPDAADMSSATAVHTTAGVDLKGIDIRLRRSPAFQVKGKVAGTIAGHPLQQLRIALVSPRHSPSLRLNDGTGAHMGANGSFDFPNQAFPPGEYYLIATQGPGTLVARQPLMIAQQDLDVVFNLQALVTLRGSIVIEGAPGDLRWLREGNPPVGTIMQVGLTPKDGPVLSNVRGRIKEDGSFELADVAPAVYGVRLAPSPSGMYVKSVKLGSQDALTTGIDVNGQTAATEFQITLSRAVSEITGVMQTDRGVPVGGTVTVVSDLPESGGGMTSGVGENGQFAFHAVSPGSYRVYGWEDLEVAQRYDPALLKLNQNQSVQVALKENSKGAEIVLIRIPAAPEKLNK